MNAKTREFLLELNAVLERHNVDIVEMELYGDEGQYEGSKWKMVLRSALEEVGIEDLKSLAEKAKQSYTRKQAKSG